MSQTKGTGRILAALRAWEDPVEQMLKVAEVAREHDMLVSRTWVNGWAEKWKAERASFVELIEAAQNVAYGNWNHAAVEEITRLREALMACHRPAKDK